MSQVLDVLQLIFEIDSATATRGIEKIERAMEGLENTAKKSTGGVTKVFDAMSSGLDKFEKGFINIENGLRNFAGGLESVGTKLSIALTAPITAFLGQSVKMAGKFQDNAAAYKVVLEGMAGDGDNFAESFGRAVSSTPKAVKDMLQRSTAVARASGFDLSEAVDFGKTATKFTYDFASFFDIDRTEAFGRVQSALNSNARAMAEYGIIITDVMKKEYMKSQGIQGEFAAQTEKVRKQIMLNLLYEKYGFMVGQATAESKMFNSQLQFAKESFQGVSAAVGTTLLPILQMFLAKINELMEKIRNLNEKVLQQAVLYMVLAAAIGPTILMIAGMIRLTSYLVQTVRLLVTGFGLFSAVLSGNIFVIGGLILGFIGILTYGDKIKAMFNSLKDYVITVPSILFPEDTGTKDNINFQKEYQTEIDKTEDLKKKTGAASSIDEVNLVGGKNNSGEEVKVPVLQTPDATKLFKEELKKVEQLPKFKMPFELPNFKVFEDKLNTLKNFISTVVSGIGSTFDLLKVKILGAIASPPVQLIIDAFKNLLSSLTTTVSKIVVVAARVLESFNGFGGNNGAIVIQLASKIISDAINNIAVPALGLLKDLFSSLEPVLIVVGNILGDVFTGVLYVVAEAFSFLSGGVKILLDALGFLSPVIAALLVTFGLYELALIGISAAETIYIGLLYAKEAALGIQIALEKLMTSIKSKGIIATLALAAADIARGIASLFANATLLLIIAGFVAVIGVIILVVKHFGKIEDATTYTIGIMWAAIKGFFIGTYKFIKTAVLAMAGVGEILIDIWRGVFDTVKGLVMDLIDSIFGANMAQNALNKAKVLWLQFKQIFTDKTKEEKDAEVKALVSKHTAELNVVKKDGGTNTSRAIQDSIARLKDNKMFNLAGETSDSYANNSEIDKFNAKFDADQKKKEDDRKKKEIENPKGDSSGFIVKSKEAVDKLLVSKPSLDKERPSEESKKLDVDIAEQNKLLNAAKTSRDASPKPTTNKADYSAIPKSTVISQTVLANNGQGAAVNNHYYYDYNVSLSGAFTSTPAEFKNMIKKVMIEVDKEKKRG